MDNQKQITFLKDQIEESINAFYKRRKSNKAKALWMHIGIIALSSTSTIILGLKFEKPEEWTKNTALVISAFVTIISSFDAFFNHKRLWVAFADALNALYSLRFDLDYRLLDISTITDEELVYFKKRYQAILDASNEKWMKLRTDDAQSKK